MKKLPYESLSEKMDALYSGLNDLSVEEFGNRFEAILAAAGWSEADFWAEENERASAKS
jgi:hypothetical protein